MSDMPSEFGGTGQTDAQTGETGVPQIEVTPEAMIRSLLVEALQYGAQYDLADHNQHGSQLTDTMDEKLLVLLRRAKALGVDVSPLYDGHELPDLDKTETY